MPSYLLLRAWHAAQKKRFVVATKDRIDAGAELFDVEGRIVARCKDVWPDLETPGWTLARFDLDPYGQARHPDLRRHLFERRVCFVLERPAVARIAPPPRLADLPAPPPSAAAHEPWKPRTAVVLPFEDVRA
jgi:hypothetical protein